MRVIVEKIIIHIYSHRFPHQSANLANMIQELNGARIFPPIIFACVNFLRISGNIGAHQSIGTKEDVEAILPVFVRFVEWFLDEGLSKI